MTDDLKKIWDKVDARFGPQRMETEAEHIDRDRLTAANAALEAQVARLMGALSPVENMHSWTESAADGEAVIMTVGTVRKMREALAAVQADARRDGEGGE